MINPGLQASSAGNRQAIAGPLARIDQLETAVGLAAEFVGRGRVAREQYTASWDSQFFQRTPPIQLQDGARGSMQVRQFSERTLRLTGRGSNGHFDIAMAVLSHGVCVAGGEMMVRRPTLFAHQGADMAVLSLMLEGDVCVGSDINTQRTAMKPGRLRLRMLNDLSAQESLASSPNRAFTYLGMVVDCARLAAELGADAEVDCLRAAFREGREIELPRVDIQTAQRILALSRDRTPKLVRLQAASMDFIASVLEHSRVAEWEMASPHGEAASRRPRWLAAITERLDREFRSPPGLNELAYAACVTPHVVASTFREHTGEHISDYCLRLRMEHAQTLLLMGEASLKEIAYSAGYRHASSFTNAYKRFYGPPAWQTRAGHPATPIAGAPTFAQGTRAARPGWLWRCWTIRCTRCPDTRSPRRSKPRSAPGADHTPAPHPPPPPPPPSSRAAHVHRPAEKPKVPTTGFGGTGAESVKVIQASPSIVQPQGACGKARRHMRTGPHIDP